MKYCLKCVLPDTRPHLRLNEAGICNACVTHVTKPHIDWKQREQAFRDVVKQARSRARSYDCIIPVSGGKDSHWQVIQCLKYGLHPLAVTWKTPARTEIGARNLANLVRLGVDHIDFQVNPNVEKKFMYQALVRHGSIAIPMHLALFNIPMNLAVKMNIPLVVWGENSAFEYGSADEAHTGFTLNSQWLRHYGVSQGTTAADWVSSELSAQELTPYFGPADEELERVGVRAVFLGYYFPWDPQISLQAALEQGFQVRTEGPKTGLYNYADIDDDFISIHHYLKWYKFGFTRLFDNLSLEIRNGRMTRDEAIAVIRETGDQTPRDDIDKFCAFVGISKDRFFEVCERFRNRDIWVKRENKWVIRDFLVTDWSW